MKIRYGVAIIAVVLYATLWMVWLPQQASPATLPPHVFVVVNGELEQCLKGHLLADEVTRDDNAGTLYTHFPNGGYQTTYWSRTGQHLDGGITYWHLMSWQVPILNGCLFQSAELANGHHNHAKRKRSASVVQRVASRK